MKTIFTIIVLTAITATILMSTIGKKAEKNYQKDSEIE
jgi:hypothetical protein